MKLSNYIAHDYTPIRGPLNVFREARLAMDFFGTSQHTRI